ncbi:MAG: glycosyltransferase, partial [Thermoanaerobaculia bacterium]
IWINRPAVDVDRIRSRSRRSIQRPLRIVAAGRLVWVKGFDYLLAALARLHERGVEFQATIFGEGELRSSLRFSIEDLGLRDYVTLAGAVSAEAVLDALHSADVFVLSSLEEGISNAVLEAMACGVPIVTTDAGGMSEAVTNGVEGFVVPIRDINALADRIEQLAGDHELRHEMGAAARTRAESDFSLARQVATFEQMYRTLTGERS